MRIASALLLFVLVAVLGGCGQRPQPAMPGRGDVDTDARAPTPAPLPGDRDLGDGADDEPLGATEQPEP